jgi:phospholipid/cholesterol/gamma-HCH transport system substrate-binding protein
MIKGEGRRGKLLGLAVCGLICAAIFVELLDLAGGLHVGATYSFEAVVPDAQQLIANSDVREAGVDIGRITGIASSGDDAVVSVAIKKSDGPIYTNATVQVRTKTLVGESYLDVDPGTANAGAIPSGGVLPSAQAKDSVQLDQILSVLSPARRARMQQLLVGLGGGLSGSGQNLNDTVRALSSTVENGAPLAETLASEHDQLPILVGDLGDVFGALGRQSTSLRRLIVSGLAAANAVGTQQRALAAGLQALPPTLTTARDTAARLAAVGQSASPVLDELTSSLDELAPALHELPAAGGATVQALDRLRSASPEVTRLLAALRDATPALTQTIPSLDGVLRQARPAVAYLTPYTQDLGGLFASLNGIGGYHDATGEYSRVDTVVAASPLVNLSSEQQAVLTELTKIGAVQLLANKGLNPYPAPNTAGDPQPMSKPYPKVEEDPAP